MIDTFPHPHSTNAVLFTRGSFTPPLQLGDFVTVINYTVEIPKTTNTSSTIAASDWVYEDEAPRYFFPSAYPY